LTRDVFDEPRWKPWIHLAEECGFRGCWSFPIETRDSNPVGTFAMYFATPRDASPHDLARADAITQAAAIIIARHTEAKERARVEVALRESETSLQQRVSAATAELRALSRRLLAVHEEERRYLARELHDEIGQMLTALQIQLATLDRESRANGKEALDKALETVRELTTRVSEISMDLRPSTLDTLGLIPALLSYLERYQGRTGVSIEMRHHGLDRRFATPIETTAYRVVQEALTNVARHSNAISASVQFLADIETMTIVIRDNGRGFDLNATADAGGLSGMRERVELLDGTWSIETEVGAGTLITAELPLSGSDSEGSIH
jgi:signal transduction histidine kinase